MATAISGALSVVQNGGTKTETLRKESHDEMLWCDRDNDESWEREDKATKNKWTIERCNSW
jgi:hypothetical protein